jgi:uncharacterized DUF497 family protein
MSHIHIGIAQIDEEEKENCLKANISFQSINMLHWKSFEINSKYEKDKKLYAVPVIDVE